MCTGIFKPRSPSVAQTMQSLYRVTIYEDLEDILLNFIYETSIVFFWMNEKKKYCFVCI